MKILFPSGILNDSAVEIEKLKGDRTMYYFQGIQPHHAGFGQWEQGHELANGWAEDSDLLQETASSLNVELFEIGKAELPQGLEDIRGSIQMGTPREPILSERIFGYLSDEGDATYFAIVGTAEEYHE